MHGVDARHVFAERSVDCAAASGVKNAAPRAPLTQDNAVHERVAVSGGMTARRTPQKSC